MTKHSGQPAAKRDNPLIEYEGIELSLTEEELREAIQRSVNDPRPDISSEEMRQFLDELYKAN